MDTLGFDRLTLSPAEEGTLIVSEHFAVNRNKVWAVISHEPTDLEEMIHSFWICTASGDVLVEKHCRGVMGRDVLSGFFDALGKSSPEEVPPMINSGRYSTINTLRNRLFYLAVVEGEVSPLFVLEFLHRVVDVFDDYFAGATEAAITKHTVTVYQVLEEMLDNGFPLATELNILKEMIKPPTWTAAIEGALGGKKVREKLPTGQLTNTAWRRAGVKYSSNEMFVDIDEMVDCIVDRNGSIIMTEIRGEINCRVKLSGMPECTLLLMNPRIMDDVSFHPCVRLNQWMTSSTLSFVPPDGRFRLVSYVIGPESQITPPLAVRPLITFDEGHGRLEVEVVARHTAGKVPEDVVVEIPLPKCVNSVNLTPSVGTQGFDTVNRTVRWTIKKMPPTGAATIRGSISIAPNSPPVESRPVIAVKFKVAAFTASSLKDEGINLSWVGTGRLNFSLDFTNDDLAQVREALLRACRRMQQDQWWHVSKNASGIKIKLKLAKEMIGALIRGLFK